MKNKNFKISEIGKIFMLTFCLILFSFVSNDFCFSSFSETLSGNAVSGHFVAPRFFLLDGAILLLFVVFGKFLSTESKLWRNSKEPEVKNPFRMFSTWGMVNLFSEHLLGNHKQNGEDSNCRYITLAQILFTVGIKERKIGTKFTDRRRQKPVLHEI